MSPACLSLFALAGFSQRNLPNERRSPTLRRMPARRSGDGLDARGGGLTRRSKPPSKILIQIRLAADDLVGPWLRLEEGRVGYIEVTSPRCDLEQRQEVPRSAKVRMNPTTWACLPRPVRLSLSLPLASHLRSRREQNADTSSEENPKSLETQAQQPSCLHPCPQLLTPARIATSTRSPPRHFAGQTRQPQASSPPAGPPSRRTDKMSTMPASHGHSEACCNIPPVVSAGYDAKGAYTEVNGLKTCMHNVRVSGPAYARTCS